MQIVCIGEVLWDVFNDGVELLGGAPLNVAAHLSRLGHATALISAVGTDQRGERALARIAELGISTQLMQRDPSVPTGLAVVRTLPQHGPTFSITRPAAFDGLKPSPEILNEVSELDPQWIYFGTLAQLAPTVEALVRVCVERVPTAGRFYDLNLREGQWNAALVERLSHLASVVKMNEAEAEELWRTVGKREDFSLDAFCRHWVSTYNLELLCITLGEKGCAIFSDDQLTTYAAVPAPVVDTVGAGDAFVAGFLHGLGQQWPISAAASFAMAVAAVVVSRAGATPDWEIQDCEAYLPKIAGPAKPGGVTAESKERPEPS